MSSRRTNLSPLLRWFAGATLLVWIAASGFCSAEHFLGHAESGTEHDSDKPARHQPDAAPSSANAGHSHDSDKDDGDEHSCCASLTTTPQFGGLISLTKPDFGKLLSLDVIWLARTLTFVQPDAPSPRQAREHECVFTPEVFLGPALRSHAPPLAFI